MLGEPGTGPLPGRVAALRDTLLERIERRHLGAVGREDLPERVNTVHRKILEVLKSGAAGGEEAAACRRSLDDLFLVVQLFSYPGDYLAGNPTVERLAETLIKFEQDLAAGGYVRPVGERRLTFRIGEPIDVREFAGVGRAREAIRACTRELQGRLQRTLDEIGEGTPAGGADTGSNLGHAGGSC